MRGSISTYSFIESLLYFKLGPIKQKHLVETLRHIFLLFMKCVGMEIGLR